jgi:Cu/Ag efflux protein CusF
VTVMKPIFTAFAALILAGSALAQQAMNGTIMRIDRLNGTVSIQQAPDGTVGASGGGVVKDFKLQGSSLDAVHAGDQVTFSTSHSGGVETITKIEKAK